VGIVLLTWHCRTGGIAAAVDESIFSSGFGIVLLTFWKFEWHLNGIGLSGQAILDVGQIV